MQKKIKDDMINRQAAIDAWCVMNCGFDNSKCPMTLDEDGAEECMFVDFLKRRPSAQPEIIRCKDCKHWLHEHLCIELSKYGTIETLPNEYCNRAERRTDD